MVPGGSGQHFGVWAEVTEADWSIITDLTAEVVEILKKKKKKKKKKKRSEITSTHSLFWFLLLMNK